MMKVLVTGAPGYIGSHVVKQLGEAGYDIVVYDNLHRISLGGYPWKTGGWGPGRHGGIDRSFDANEFEAVLHFAANIVVPESVTNPLKYYANNTRNTPESSATD